MLKSESAKKEKELQKFIKKYKKLRDQGKYLEAWKIEREASEKGLINAK
jgi:hypothetical protein